MSEPNLQRHGSPEWPECWCFYNRGDIALGNKAGRDTRPECGSLVRFDRGCLTYACTCGESHTRGEPGFENEKTAAWIARHKHHLPEELRLK